LRNANSSDFEVNMKVIHCIGDSHSCFFYGQDKQVEFRCDGLIPCFKVYPIGPSLAYNLCVNGSTTGGREQVLALLDNKIPPQSRLLLCFGEIDCRHHILKQAEKHKTDIKIVVEDCVKRYFDFVKEIKAKGYEVLVWGVLPSAPDFGGAIQSRPQFGTCAERNVLTRYFNTTLKKLLDSESIIFVSVFERLVDENNNTKDQYFMDQNHLSQMIMPTVIKEMRGYFDDIPEMKTPVLTKIYIGGKSAIEGWKTVNANKASSVDLGLIESNSVDELYACNYLQRLGYRDEIIVALKEIYRVLKPGAVFRFSVLDLEALCSLFVHPNIKPPHQMLIAKLIYRNGGDKHEHNNIGFNMSIAANYLAANKFGGYSGYRRVPEFKMFEEESSVDILGNNVMLNIEAVK
jgi:predicted SAM-dependent methyltransferase